MNFIKVFIEVCVSDTSCVSVNMCVFKEKKLLQFCPRVYLWHSLSFSYCNFVF